MTLTQRGAAPATSIPDEVVDEVELDRVVRAVAAKATEWAHTISLCTTTSTTTTATDTTMCYLSFLISL